MIENTYLIQDSWQFQDSHDTIPVSEVRSKVIRLLSAHGLVYPI